MRYLAEQQSCSRKQLSAILCCFLTPKPSYFQTQFASDFLLCTLCPLTHTPNEFRLEGGGGLQGRRSCVRRQNSKSFALGETRKSVHKVQHFIPHTAIPFKKKIKMNEPFIFLQSSGPNQIAGLGEALENGRTISC